MSQTEQRSAAEAAQSRVITIKTPKSLHHPLLTAVDLDACSAQRSPQARSSVLTNTRALERFRICLRPQSWPSFLIPSRKLLSVVGVSSRSGWLSLISFAFRSFSFLEYSPKAKSFPCPHHSVKSIPQ